MPEVVRSNVERFAALGVLQVVVNSDGRLVVAEKEDRDGAGLVHAEQEPSQVHRESSFASQSSIDIELAWLSPWQMAVHRQGECGNSSR